MSLEHCNFCKREVRAITLIFNENKYTWKCPFCEKIYTIKYSSKTSSKSEDKCERCGKELRERNNGDKYCSTPNCFINSLKTKETSQCQ